MRSLLAALLLASIASPAMAQAIRDTLADAVASAIDSNPTLMAERKTRAVADETLEQAKAQMRPQVGLSGNFGTQYLEFGRTFSTPSGNFPLHGRQASKLVRRSSTAARSTLSVTRPARASMRRRPSSSAPSRNLCWRS